MLAKVGMVSPERMILKLFSGNRWHSTYALLMTLVSVSITVAQQPPKQVALTVVDEKGTPLAGASVRLVEMQSHTSMQGVTSNEGTFAFRNVDREPVSIVAMSRGAVAHMDVPADRLSEPVKLVLDSASKGSVPDDMAFSDEPSFTVAGVTDWTAVGGHGSDATLRTSESLAIAMANLPNTEAADIASEEELKLESAIRGAGSLSQKAEVQAQVHRALQAHATATLYRLAAEADEANGDSLSAVREFAQAASMEPSEANEFEWGSELLLHRALFQAQEVFTRGAAMFPTSVRLQTALGTALFTEARYDAAAVQLCKASDLAPGEIDPYMYMGRVELASPGALPCVESHLARFTQLNPRSSDAKYLYAMAILKRLEVVPDDRSLSLSQTLLNEAVKLDPRCGDAYLELGILAAQQQNMPKAIEYYNKAIEAKPKLAEAYYRVAKAYTREGEIEKAKAAMATHDILIHQQAVETEQQRKAVKQFLFANPDEAPTIAPEKTKP